MTGEEKYLPDVHIPHFPKNDEVRVFIRVMDGQSQRVFFSMRDTTYEHRGTPQETQDWTNPEEWIPSILSGNERDLAFHLWRASEGVINPRHVRGVWLLSSSYDLIAPDEYEILHITPAGYNYLDHPSGEAVRHIDYSEGLLNLLLIVSEHGPGKRSDLLPPFAEFLNQYSNRRSENVMQGTWYERMRNLSDRGFVSRSGMTYEITSDGLDYLEQAGDLLLQIGREPVSSLQNEIRRLLREQQREVQQQLADTLAEMDPFAVEFLVKRLLEAMEYDNVEVTNKSRDGGVDVVADIEVGITSVREVIQVKRYKGNIQRPILDQLRGSLHRFGATRGTIITTGGVSSGAREAAFERGAPPITLIDGERLIDLLIEHNIGVRKREIKLVEFEPADFVEEVEE